MARYIGFSTKQYGFCNSKNNIAINENNTINNPTNNLVGKSYTNRTFRLTDINLVKQDLLNQIFTVKGERVMQPSFGSIIPNLIFEQFDEQVVSIVEEEITRIIRDDPRVEIVSLNVKPNYDTHTIVVSVTLNYIELDLIDNFDLNIQFE